MNLRSSKKKWRPFRRARAFVCRLGFKSQGEWFSYCCGRTPAKPPLPADLPRSPQVVYRRTGWKSWGNWLGTGYIAPWLRKYRSFPAARHFAQSLGLKNLDQWKKYAQNQIPGLPRLPKDLPANPALVYRKKGWKGYGDWLGTGTIASFLRKYRSLSRARSFARRLKLKSRTEWSLYVKGLLPRKPRLPADIPANPALVYKGSWKGWGHWLGTGTLAPRFRKYRPYESAKKFVHQLGLKNGTLWRAYAKGALPGKPPLPKDIPAFPPDVYGRKGWKGWGDWLGTGNVGTHCRK